MKLEYKVMADKEFEGAWRVEALDTKSGDIFIAIFAGPDSERLANEYSAFRNGKHPAAKPEVVTPPVPATTFTKDNESLVLTLKTGEVISLNLKSTEWSKDPRNKSAVIGKPKPAFNIIEGKKGQEIC